MSTYRGASDALKVYRIALGLTAGAVVLLPIPYINILGGLLLLGGSVASFIGLGLFVAATPSGVGLGARLGAMVGLAVVGVIVIFQSIGRWSQDTPLMVVGMLCLVAAGASFHLFWMKAAEAVNAWRVAESFKLPLVMSVVGSVISILLQLAEAPVPLRLVVTGTLSLATFGMFWSSLSQLQNALAFGVSEED